MAAIWNVNDVAKRVLQSLLSREWIDLTIFSLIAVFLLVFFWWRFVYVLQTFPSVLDKNDILYLVNSGLQKQLFWGIAVLTSFIGFFQYLAVIDHDRASSRWLHKLVCGCFIAATVFVLTKIAEYVRWVAEFDIQAEEQFNIPLSLYGKTLFTDVIRNGFWAPIIVGLISLFLWFVFLCLFVEKMN